MWGNGLGASFVPDEQNAAMSQQTAASEPVSEAIKILSLRLPKPRMMGAQAMSPDALMQPHITGYQGPESIAQQALLRAFGRQDPQSGGGVVSPAGSGNVLAPAPSGGLRAPDPQDPQPGPRLPPMPRLPPPPPGPPNVIPTGGFIENERFAQPNTRGPFNRPWVNRPATGWDR